MRILSVAALAFSSLTLGQPAIAATADPSFLDFPYVDAVSAAKVPAFAWLAKQGDRSSILFTRAPEFRRVVLATRGDEEGQPITDVQLAADGKHIVFTTGAPRGDQAFNPASLVEGPSATLWLIATSPGAKAVKVGAGLEPSFSADGRMLLFKRDGDLWSVDTDAPVVKPKVFAKGAAAWSQFAWTKSGDLIFVDDRRGYSFLGRYRPHAREVDWLVTGVDRLAVPVLSPNGDRIAFLRLPGRKHSTTPDQTEAEPFSIELLDLASGAVRTLWNTRGPAVTLGMDDPEGALRWASDETLVFYSEDDYWGRLYPPPVTGGPPRPLTPTGCTVAESEKSDSGLVVIDNCRDRDTRQISLIDPATGSERPLAAPDPVLADAAAAGPYVALVGATAEQAPMIRILELRSGKRQLAESYADYGYSSPLTSPPPREVHLASTDGIEFTGQLFT